MKQFGAVLLAMSMLCSATVHAGEDLIEALKEGKPYVDIRLRYEYVDQDGIDSALKIINSLWWLSNCRCCNEHHN